MAVNSRDCDLSNMRQVFMTRITAMMGILHILQVHLGYGSQSKKHRTAVSFPFLKALARA